MPDEGLGTISWSNYVDGVLRDPDVALVLSDETGAFGVRRDDIGDMVVPAGTAMTRRRTGVYRYTFTVPEPGLTYEYWVKAVNSGITAYVEGHYRHYVPRACGSTLAELRRRLVELTGRYELVYDHTQNDWTDRGANCFLKAGKRWLEQHYPERLPDDPWEEDDDTCWWSLHHPELVVRAARMQIENDLHRNTSGWRDIAEGLMEELQQIYHRSVLADWGHGGAYDTTLDTLLQRDGVYVPTLMPDPRTGRRYS